MPRKKSLIFTIDSETDPFEYGIIPQPFSWGVYSPDYDNGEVNIFWSTTGNNCTKSVVHFLKGLPPRTKLYAHNGGNFDFHFLIDYANREELTIINGRIAKMKIGNCTLIDSFLLIPFALEQYKKTKIDYNKFKTENRWKHKDEIISYLKDDCIDLHKLITGFQKIVGKKLTIGGAAFGKMKDLEIPIYKGNETHDERYRPFYFGGRVEAFKTGYFKPRKKLKYIDINSAYPAAMMDEHPHGNRYIISKTLPKKAGAWFIKFKGISKGCLPIRADDDSLSFPCDDIERTYYCTGWEIYASLDNDALVINEILEVREPQFTRNFKGFITKYFKLRDQAKKSGDKIGNLAYKYLINSGYGKFATDPRKFAEWVLSDYGDMPAKDGGEPFEWHSDISGVSLFKRSAYDGKGFYDVATAASITGHVRAFIFSTMCNCNDVYYCDTDSIVCGSYNNNVNIGEKLGEWDLEAEISEMAIAGKKLYAAKIGNKSCIKHKSVSPDDYCRNCKNDKSGINCERVWKTASKGVILTASEIKEIALGGEVTARRDAPTFSVRFGARFVERTIKGKLQND